MKKFVSLLILVTVLGAPIYAQKYYASDWKWYLLDDFENCNNWPVINGEYYKPQYYYSNPRLAIISGGSKNLTESPKKNCLGIKILYIGREAGTTEAFVIPIKPIEIPGVCKKITFWVNGRNKKLAIRVRFANYANYIYDLEPEPSVLEFYGWKELVIDNIDKKIPQINPNRSDYKPLKILSFIIDNKFRRTFYKPFYIYIDHLKAYCNEYKLPSYDGSEIPDKW